MADFIVIALVALITGAAARYVWKAKKSGKTCIGCPGSGSCSGSCCSRLFTMGAFPGGSITRNRVPAEAIMWFQSI